jgi:hypothetical protein
MNKKTAKMVAGLVGGRVIDSGGGVLIVEIPNYQLMATLCLGNGGWWIEDKDGIHVVDGENLG